MPNLKRRGFLAASAAAASLRALPPILADTARRRPILKLIYGKSLGIVRAIDTLVP